MNDVLSFLGEQMDQLRPANKPTSVQIQSAKAAAMLVDAYVETICVCMEYGKRKGECPDIDLMTLGNGTSTKKARDSQ